MTAMKSIIVDLDQEDKLNYKNYDVWHRKIQYIKFISTQPMAKLEHGNTTQHRRDMEAYQAYKHKDRVARILMFSSMRNDIMLRFERHRSV